VREAGSCRTLPTLRSGWATTAVYAKARISDDISRQSAVQYPPPDQAAKKRGAVRPPRNGDNTRRSEASCASRQSDNSVGKKQDDEDSPFVARWSQQAAQLPRPAIRASRRRSTSGIRMSFDTMRREDRFPIPIAAPQKAPRQKAAIVNKPVEAGERQGRATNLSAVDLPE